MSVSVGFCCLYLFLSVSVHFSPILNEAVMGDSTSKQTLDELEDPVNFKHKEFMCDYSNFKNN